MPAWKQKEKIGNATLFLGDSKKVLTELKNKNTIVDGVITDPPYGIGKKYSASYKDIHKNYPKWLWERLSPAEDMCSPGSPIFIFQSTTNIRKFVEWFPRDWQLYISAKNFVQVRKTVTMRGTWDSVVCWWTPGKPYVLRTRNTDFFVCDTASEVSRTKNLSHAHPYPRPLSQMYILCEQWIKPKGCVLDPFMGGGTTLVAAEQLGLRSIGIEIEKEYFDLACTRVANTKLGRFFSR